MRELAHYGADRDAFGAAVSAPGVVLEDSAFQDRSAFFEVLAGDGESELVDQAETINIGDGKSRLGHVEVFQMGSVGTSIFGRPRHLSVHRHANGCYTLICEEPDNQGSGCGLMLGIIALLIGVPLFILVIAISGGEEEEPQASCRPGTMEDDSAIPEEYREALESAAAESGLSVDLLAAQIDAESGWNPDATSPVGAQGIVQFMPQAWDTYGDGGDPFNAQDAIAAMGRYMAAVADEVTDLAGNERELAELSLAAYNAGPGAVQSAGGIDRRLPVAMTARIRRSLTGRSSALQPTHANVKCDSQRLLAVSSQRHMSPLRRVGRWFIGQVISLHLQQCADDDGRGCVFVREGGPDYGW